MARVFPCPECHLSTAEVKKWFEAHPDVKDVQYDSATRLARFEWTGHYKQLRSLEALLQTEHVSVHIVSPLRLDLQFNPRRGGTFRTADMEQALKKIDCLKVTSFGAGSYEVWMKFDGLRALDGVGTAADSLGCDLEYRSHDMFRYALSGGDATTAARAVEIVKGVVFAEVEGSAMRVFARRNSLTDKRLGAALAPLKLDAQRQK